jgi:pimeloyl-ACP methyl ester carboxylesterase
LKSLIDHWDPALLDVLASERDVIVFDDVGSGRSSGTAPTTIDGLAEGLLEFVDALGLRQVDLLGWSMGGYVVQAATLKRPGLVRRLVIAGSGPGRVPDMPVAPERVSHPFSLLVFSQHTTSPKAKRTAH